MRGPLLRTSTDRIGEERREWIRHPFGEYQDDRYIRLCGGSPCVAAEQTVPEEDEALPICTISSHFRTAGSDRSFERKIANLAGRSDHCDCSVGKVLGGEAIDDFFVWYLKFHACIHDSASGRALSGG